MHRFPTLALLLSLLAAALPSAADEAGDLNARLEVLARPETAERLAAYARNLYEALLARGFGQEQAVQMVLAFANSGAGVNGCGAGGR